LLDEAVALATKAGCVDLLIKAIKTHSGNAGVTTEACKALCNIVVNGCLLAGLPACLPDCGLARQHYEAMPVMPR
jgi:hypothetical protein